MRFIFIGPPGSGKGTQSKRLASRFAIPHISTGEILRDAVVEGTPLGRQAAPIMAAGKLVPDDVMVGIIRERLSKADTQDGFVLDGFPRTVVQAEKLEHIIRNSTEPVHVIQLLVPDEHIVQRIALRRTCAECGAIYHLRNNPPKRDGVCDLDGGALTAREDDTEENVRKRLEGFHRQTEPVAQYYSERKMLHRIEGVGALDEVFERIEKSFA